MQQQAIETIPPLRDDLRDHAELCRAKMVATLVRAWGEGYRQTVKQIIGRALIPRLGEQWQAGVAATLTGPERRSFLEYMDAA